MNPTDIARTRRQVEQVADAAQEIIDDAETIADAGFDPAQSETILVKQRALVDELAQALADFNELTNRAETVETGRVAYEPARDAFDLVYDETNATVTITYQGTPDLAVADLTVTKAGTDVTPYGDGPLTTGATGVVDVSGLATDGSEQVRVSWTAARVTPEQVAIKPWGDVTGTTSPPEISVSGLDLPSDNLVPETETFTRTIRIGTPTDGV
jgi:hypothetical protein